MQPVLFQGTWNDKARQMWPTAPVMGDGRYAVLQCPGEPVALFMVRAVAERFAGMRCGDGCRGPEAHELLDLGGGVFGRCQACGRWVVADLAAVMRGPTTAACRCGAEHEFHAVDPATGGVARGNH